MIDLDGRCGAAQQHFGSVHAGQHHGGVAPVVAGSGVLLLIAGVVLLVHDDQPQLGIGQKHRGAHAQHHTRLVGVEQLFPHVHALVVAEFAVIDEQAVAKDGLEAPRELRGERDFGHEIEHLPPQLERMGYHVHIDRSFAA